MKIVILCGGFGMRLRSVVADLPKPLAPVNGVPFLEILIREFERVGASEIYLSTHYLSEKIEEFAGTLSCSIPVKIIFEQAALGTGGAMRNAVRFLEDDLFFVNGDTFLFDLDRSHFSKLQEFAGDLAILGKQVATPNSRRFRVFHLDASGRIVDAAESAFHCLSLGVYFVRKTTFEMADTLSVPFSIDDFVETHSATRTYSVYATDIEFIDIGVPEDYMSFVEYNKNEKYTIS